MAPGPLGPVSLQPMAMWQEGVVREKDREGARKPKEQSWCAMCMLLSVHGRQPSTLNLCILSWNFQ